MQMLSCSSTQMLQVSCCRLQLSTFKLWLFFCCHFYSGRVRIFQAVAEIPQLQRLASANKF